MSETKAFLEVEKLNEFMEVLRETPNKAVYGIVEVK